MRIKDYTIENQRIKRLKKELEDDDHISSGGLTASSIYWPLQWQILKSLGIEPRKDDYALGLFERGKEVEESCLKDIVGIIETQKDVNYKGVRGIIDVIVDTKNYEKDYGVVPMEIKSVKNAKFARILKEDNADLQYRLQATVYALAMKKDYYGIIIKSADDGRVLTYFYETKDTSDFIEKVITEYSDAKQKGIIPSFKIRDDAFEWQEKPAYNLYPEFLKLTPEESMRLVNKIKEKNEN